MQVTLLNGRLQRWPDATPGPEPVGEAGDLPASSPFALVVHRSTPVLSRSAYRALVGGVIIVANRPIAPAIGRWLDLAQLSPQWSHGKPARRRVRSAAAGKPADCDVGYAQRVSSNHFGSRSSAS
jgi:hypothetical protein